MSNSWPELMGIGAAVHDTLIVVAEYPLEDTKLETLETKIQGGGPCATALAAAHKLSVPAAYMGRIGADAFGRSILEEFSALGMQTRFVRTAMNEVSFHSVVLLNQTEIFEYNISYLFIWNIENFLFNESVADAFCFGGSIVHQVFF